MSAHKFTISGPWKLIELKTYLVHSKYKNVVFKKKFKAAIVVATSVIAALGR